MISQPRRTSALVKWDLLDDDDRIERAAYEGGAQDLIRSLSKGYDTILGKEFDEGC